VRERFSLPRQVTVGDFKVCVTPVFSVDFVLQHRCQHPLSLKSPIDILSALQVTNHQGNVLKGGLDLAFCTQVGTKVGPL
jgi:hypothetical protein